MSLATTLQVFPVATSAFMNESVVSDEVISFRYFGISIAAFAIFVGTIGNLLTILAYFSNRKLQTTFNLIVVNLSVVDFITAALMLPFNLAGYVQMDWPFGRDSFTARLQSFSYFSCGYTSVVFLVAITVNRFIGAFWPTKYDKLFERNRMIFLLVFCWVFAPILLFPFLVGTDPRCKTPNHALTGYRSDQFLCTFLCLRNGWLAWMQVTRILFQFIPLGIMVVLYFAIFFKLHKKAKRLEKSMAKGLRSGSLIGTAVATGKLRSSVIAKPTFLKQTSSQTSITKTTLTKRKSSMAETRRAQNNKRMLLISLVICIAFMVTFLPSVIVNLLPNRASFDPRVHMAASNLSWFNSSLNPIIYVILNRRFRREYLRLIKFIFGKTKGKFVNDSSSTAAKIRANTNSPSIKRNGVLSTSKPHNKFVSEHMGKMQESSEI